MLDILIQNAMLHDGMGSSPFHADIAIEGDSIADIGMLEGAQAAHIIDAQGAIAAPGFIDMHSHADLYLLEEKQSLPKLLQGVTTEVVGNCGLSIVPVRPEDIDASRDYLGGTLGDYHVPFRGSSVSDYLGELEKGGTGVNVAPLVAHGAVRRKVMGFSTGIPTAPEMKAMGDEVSDALDTGCFGLSTGLAYPPAFFSKQQEFVTLARSVAARGGIFSIHMRSEGTYLLESVDEAIAIGREAGVSLEISHLKAYGRKNWHKMGAVLEKIERTQGFPVSFDSYPYTFGSTTLSALLPPSLFQQGASLRDLLGDSAARESIMRDITIEEEGTENYAVSAGWDGLIFAGGMTEKNRHFEGKSIAALADELSQSPEAAILSLLLDEGGSASMLIRGMDEERVAEVIAHGLHLFGSDGLYGRKPHPRTYGTFARALEHFVKKKRTISLAEAIRQMTSAPAQKLGLKRRGTLRKGYYADLVIFDLERLSERSTIEEPRQHPEGIDYVLVNGVIMVEKGKVHPHLPGRVLRRES